MLAAYTNNLCGLHPKYNPACVAEIFLYDDQRVVLQVTFSWPDQRSVNKEFRLSRNESLIEICRRFVKEAGGDSSGEVLKLMEYAASQLIEDHEKDTVDID